MTNKCDVKRSRQNLLEVCFSPGQYHLATCIRRPTPSSLQSHAVGASGNERSRSFYAPDLVARSERILANLYTGTGCRYKPSDIAPLSQPELGTNRIVLNATKQAPAPQASKYFIFRGRLRKSRTMTGRVAGLRDKEGAFSFPWLRGPVPPAPWVLGRRGAARPWETRRATRFVFCCCY